MQILVLQVTPCELQSLQIAGNEMQFLQAPENKENREENSKV